MGLLMLFFGGVAKDVLAATVFLRRRQNAKADEIVRCWQRRHQKIPFANWYLKRKAGRPVGFIETKRNAAIISGARTLVNSETFEHLVGAVLNKRSKLKLRMPSALKKGGSGTPRRHWGKVTIIS